MLEQNRRIHFHAFIEVMNQTMREGHIHFCIFIYLKFHYD